MKRTPFFPLFILAVTGLFFACGEEEENNQTAYTCVDYSGKSYKTVVIGDQVWMAENLASRTDSVGGEIRNSKDILPTSSQAFPQCCYYNDQPGLYDTYGLMYNHFAIKQSVVPKGWRLPTRADWEKLIAYVEAHPAYGTNSWVGKALSSTDWKISAATGAIGFERTTNNKFGFNAKSGGYKTEAGTYRYESEQTCFWTSTPDPTTPTNLQLVSFYYGLPNLQFLTLDALKCAAYVRCVRDL